MDNAESHFLVLCKSCNKRLPAESAFCGYCGQPVAPDTAGSVRLHCPSCGKSVMAESVFCGSCGVALHRDNDTLEHVSRDQPIAVVEGSSRERASAYDHVPTFVDSTPQTPASTRKGKKVFIVVSSVVAVMLTIVAGIAYVNTLQVQPASPYTSEYTYVPTLEQNVRTDVLVESCKSRDPVTALEACYALAPESERRPCHWSEESQTTVCGAAECSWDNASNRVKCVPHKDPEQGGSPTSSPTAQVNTQPPADQNIDGTIVIERRKPVANPDDPSAESAILHYPNGSAFTIIEKLYSPSGKPSIGSSAKLRETMVVASKDYHGEPFGETTLTVDSNLNNS
jgi:predicted RNA-binding Zn-ribbon protein involved in translation (DUF1610 family)